MRERAGSVRRFPLASQRHLPQSARPMRASWESRYQLAVVCADLAVILGVVITVNVLVGASTAWHAGVFAVLTLTAVFVGLGGARAWSVAVLGHGAEEFRRLYRGLFTAIVLLAMGGFAFGLEGLRPWVFLAVPAMALIDFPVRYLLRRLLHKRRQVGRCLLPVLAAGGVDTVKDLIDRTRKAPHQGWRVEAVCTTDGLGTGPDGRVDTVPVVGRIEDVAEQVHRGGYRVVAVTADAYWTPKRLQRLAWQLESTSAELVVAPVLMEVAGPRLNVTGVHGMPLLRLSAPAFTGARRVVKEVMDRVGGTVLVALLSPFLAAISLSIKFNDGGPVFYRQRRIGKDGKAFTMIKFRTMVPDAHAQRLHLLAMNEAEGPLFKMRKDPRVTRIGAVLRRFSMDELPQLFNVISGSMSLVGPRPPLPEETERYSSDARRRLLVKPGLTGLWQVSGRSDLPWEEAVRLDLRYVEDWSLALDALIMWKTVRAVLKGQGAY
ncbi:sugar transferase [Kibdelosporangium phytohabitans]|uniref:Exopolysaccharide biosynthesis polyprenyl glycosylphosphotransferase n=1 Tax=Kibdelosporangium phytohabitans TaxID=860235 RepID=A0A0N7F5F7_9PSEU|nr:sugar transferase [Kibdelosporangium phytohabitans]ALG14103.1 exopolysaccharide biosynthesis polyprenyl glycosylphosphotransferase [Kibdelosporangium phytohabitans]